MVIDFILRLQDGKGYGVSINGRNMYDLDFADDIALISTSNEQLQQCTELKQNAEKVGLRFNNKKCEVMSSPCENVELKIGNELIKTTDAFTYLGSKINNLGNANDEIRTRIGKANAAFSRMSKIFRSKHISIPTKIKIYNATTIPILLYGSETWQLYATDISRLNAFHRNCLRSW